MTPRLQSCQTHSISAVGCRLENGYVSSTFISRSGDLGRGGHLDSSCPWDLSVEVGERMDCQVERVGEGMEGGRKTGKMEGREAWRPGRSSR